MGVHCQILIKIPREGVHRAGKSVNGIIKYAIDKPTEYRHVTLSLIGSGRCWWTETDSNNDSSSYTGTEDYIAQHISLLRQPGEPVIIPVGSYEYPFQFMLPENIPPSIKNKTCTISYHLKLKFVKTALFSVDRVFKSELTVYSYVAPSSPQGPVIFGLEKSVLTLFGVNPKIYLKAEIEKTIFAPGDNAKLSLIVTNDTDITGWSVITTVQSHTVYTANCGRTKTDTKIFKESTTELSGLASKVTSMSRIVPILPELYSVQNSKIMIRNYNVIVTLRMPAPHMNAQVAMPIIVGEIRGNEVGIQPEETLEYWDSLCEETNIPKKYHKA